MATERMTLLARIEDAARSEQPDLLREALEWALQRLMEDQVTERLGAGPHERSPERTGQRNGHRPRLLDTRAGDARAGHPQAALGQLLPRLAPRAAPARRAGPRGGRPGGLCPGRLHAPGRRPRAGHGHRGHQPQRGVPHVRRARRRRGAPSASAASTRRATPTSGSTPRTSRSTTAAGRVQTAIVVATGVNEHGEREVLGLAVGDSEDGAFWTAFLRSLDRGALAGVRLVITDAHEGLKGAVARGAPRRRVAALIGTHSVSGPSGPDSPRRGAPWQRRPIEVPRQTRAPAGWRGPHRPEGDVPESTER